MGWRVEIHDKREWKELITTLQTVTKRSLAPILRAVLITLTDEIYKTVMGYIEKGRSEWKPLSAVTIALKGSTKLLVDSGDYQKAIQIQRGDESAEVGILVPHGSRGQDLEQIARVIEGGAAIKVTEKIRKLFATVGIFLRMDTRTLYVPARPVFAPAIEQMEEDLEKLMDPHIDALLETLNLRA